MHTAVRLCTLSWPIKTTTTSWKSNTERNPLAWGVTHSAGLIRRGCGPGGVLPVDARWHGAVEQPEALSCACCDGGGVTAGLLSARRGTQVVPLLPSPGPAPLAAHVQLQFCPW